MKNLTLTILIAVMVITSGCSESLTSSSNEPAMSHDVFFALNDNSDQATAELIDACYKYLSNHDGVVFFAAGPRVTDNDRGVNVLDFDVALHIVFKNEKHQDVYQNADDHHKFIEENKDNWKSVRVFDSFISK